MAKECCSSQKEIARDDALIKNIDSRLNRVIGQLNAIKNMVDTNKYCGDILMQVAAVESALQNIGYLILNDHLNTCVKNKIINGDEKVIDETMVLIKQLNK